MKSSKSYLPQKLLAMALSLALVFTWMIPSSLAVYATDEEEPVAAEEATEQNEEAQTVLNAQEATALPEAVDGVVTLTEDVALTDTATFAEDCTLDLAGYTIDGTAAYTAIKVTGGTLTIKDSSTDSTGKIKVTDLTAGTAVAVQKNTSLIMESGAIEVSGQEAAGLYPANGASVEMKGGSITASGSGALGICAMGSNVKVVVKDNASISVSGQSSMGISLQGGSSSAVVEGGVITAEGDGSLGISAVNWYGGHDVTVSGGEISAKGSRANAVFLDGESSLKVSGGTLKSEDAATIGLQQSGNSAEITGGTITGKTYGIMMSNVAGSTIKISSEAVSGISGESGQTNGKLIKASDDEYTVIPSSAAYVLMNIPYDEYYDAEGVSGVDTVTSATVKTYNTGMAGGSYHKGSLEVTDPATDDPLADAEILGVTYPVYVSDITVLEGQTEVTDETKATITVASGKSSRVTKEVEGTDVLFASGDYAYYTLSEVPANYKTLSVDDEGNFNFSAVKNGAETKEITSADISYGGHYTPLTLNVAAEEITDDSVVTAILISAGEETYALRHVENVWRKTQLGWYWTDFDGNGLSGKTITNITYYLQDGGVYSYDVDVKIKKNPEAENFSAEFEDGKTVSVSGLPEDIENAKVTVSTGRGDSLVLIADGAEIVEGTVATEAAVGGTEYKVNVVSDNYADISATAKYTLDMAASDAIDEASDLVEEAEESAAGAAAEAATDAVIDAASEVTEAAVEAAEAAVKAAEKSVESAETEEDKAVEESKLAAAKDLLAAATKANAAVKTIAANSATKKANAAATAAANGASAGTAQAVANAQAAANAAAEAKAKADAAVEAAKAAVEAADATGDDEAKTAAAEALTAAQDAATAAGNAVTAANNALTAAQNAKAAADQTAAEIAANNGVLDPSLPTVKIKAAKKAKKSFTANWKKLSKKNQKAVTKIEVEYSTTADFSSGNVFKSAKKSKTSLKVKKLKSKQTYFMRAHTYKVVNGVKYVSSWSKVKKVKVK